MCRLACNVWGGITAVEVTRRRFFDITLVSLSFVDLSGLPWYPSCPIAAGKLPSFGLQCTLWFIYLCVGRLRAVLTSHRHLCSTEVSSASLLSSVRSVTTSTNIERHSHCPRCQGYQMAIIGYELERGEWILPVVATCCRRVLLCTHIYTLPRDALCWRQLLLDVCTESARLLVGPD